MANSNSLRMVDDALLDQPIVRRIEFSDVFDALRQGFDDFRAKPSHYAFICLIYPIVGLILITWSSGGNALQLVYPLMTGFALLGPLAAIGLYEISRRRETGLDASWRHALDVANSPSIAAMLAVGALLVLLFVGWLLSAQALYQWVYGDASPATLTDWLSDVLTTSRGWTLIVLGNLVGLLFALLVLATSVVAFPLLLDRTVGASTAIRTSARVMSANPLPILLWGLIVALGLFLGSLPLLVGLAIVLPILGHASWHLYRKAVEPATPGERLPLRDDAGIWRDPAI